MERETSQLEETSSDRFWRDIHHRLENSRQHLEERFNPTPQQRYEMMRERSRKIARAPEERSSVEQAIELVEFTLGQERYAVESSFIREVCPLKDITPLPGAPSFVVGIINVRGQIVSVIDLRRLFGLADAELSGVGNVIILHNAQMEFGILTDEVVGMSHLSPENLQPSLLVLAGAREEYLLGITADRVAVIHAERLLTDAKLIVQDAVE